MSVHKTDLERFVSETAREFALFGAVVGFMAGVFASLFVLAVAL